MTIFPQILYERIYFISAYYSPELTHAIRLMLNSTHRFGPISFSSLNFSIKKSRKIEGELLGRLSQSDYLPHKKTILCLSNKRDSQ